MPIECGDLRQWETNLSSPSPQNAFTIMHALAALCNKFPTMKSARQKCLSWERTDARALTASLNARVTKNASTFHWRLRFSRDKKPTKMVAWLFLGVRALPTSRWLTLSLIRLFKCNAKLLSRLPLRLFQTFFASAVKVCFYATFKMIVFYSFGNATLSSVPFIIIRRVFFFVVSFIKIVLLILLHSPPPPSLSEYRYNYLWYPTLFLHFYIYTSIYMLH